VPLFAGCSSPDKLPARVVIATKEPVTRIGFRAVLGDDPDVALIGEAGTLDELFSACHRLRPDVVVIDVGLLGFAERVARALLEASPRTRVLILSPRDAPEAARAARVLGCAAIIYADATAIELRRALSDAIAGVSPRPGTPKTQTQTSTPATFGDLSKREQEVLILLASGCTNREIAQRLTVTPHTVKKHVEHILAKLGVNDRTAAAVRAVELGFVGERPRFAVARSRARTDHL
jgi:DNA-binding NarL/FixJ family response regulator